MASQVLSGTSSVSYTNNTGQNVRIVINYMDCSTNVSLNQSTLNMNWAGVSISYSVTAGVRLTIGRNLAGVVVVGGTGGNSISNAQGMVASSNIATQVPAYPTELMLSPGQTFAATCGNYNIVIIPEGG